MTETDTGGAEASGEPPVRATPPGRPRGWASVYAAAFVLMLTAAATLVVAVKGFLASTTPLWVSAGLSAAAIVTSVASVVLPRRR